MILRITKCEECIKQCLRIKLTVTSTSPEWLRGYYCKRTSSSFKRQTHKKKELEFCVETQIWRCGERMDAQRLAETARPTDCWNSWAGRAQSLMVTWTPAQQVNELPVQSRIKVSLVRFGAACAAHALESGINHCFVERCKLMEGVEESLWRQHDMTAKTGMDIFCSTLTIHVATCWGWCWTT